MGQIWKSCGDSARPQLLAAAAVVAAAVVDAVVAAAAVAAVVVVAGAEGMATELDLVVLDSPQSPNVASTSELFSITDSPAQSLGVVARRLGVGAARTEVEGAIQPIVLQSGPNSPPWNQ